MTSAASSTTGSSPVAAIGVIVVIIALFGAYWIPTVVAYTRHVQNAASIFVINLFLGWTGFGWVIALAMAVRDPKPAMMMPSQYPPWMQQGGPPGQPPLPLPPSPTGGQPPQWPQQPSYMDNQAGPTQPWQPPTQDYRPGPDSSPAE